MSFSDFIIYADESGSPVLDADATDFPIFVLVFLLVRKSDYVQQVVPAVQGLKFDTIGHDQLVLHERDIRRQGADFAFLQVDADSRRCFLDRINKIVAEAPVTLCCMELAAHQMWEPGRRGDEISVIFESRGRTEDQTLELEFSRIADGRPRLGRPDMGVTNLRWVPRFADKRCNSTGLQLGRPHRKAARTALPQIHSAKSRGGRGTHKVGTRGT